MVARLEELQLREPVECPKQRQPQLQQAVMDVATQIEQLEKASLPATSAGQERRHFMERLQAYQRDYEKQLGELEQRSRCSRILMLSVRCAIAPLDASLEPGSRKTELSNRKLKSNSG